MKNQATIEQKIQEKISPPAPFRASDPKSDLAEVQREYGVISIRTLKVPNTASDDINQTSQSTIFPTLDRFQNIVSDKFSLIQQEVTKCLPQCTVTIRKCRRFSKYSGDLTISPAIAVPIIKAKFNDWFKGDFLRLKIDQEKFAINRVPKSADMEKITLELSQQGFSGLHVRWISQKNFNNPTTQSSSLILSVNPRLSDPLQLERLRQCHSLLLLGSIFPVRKFLDTPPKAPTRHEKATLQRNIQTGNVSPSSTAQTVDTSHTTPLPRSPSSSSTRTEEVNLSLPRRL